MPPLTTDGGGTTYMYSSSFTTQHGNAQSTNKNTTHEDWTTVTVPYHTQTNFPTSSPNLF